MKKILLLVIMGLPIYTFAQINADLLVQIHPVSETEMQGLTPDQGALAYNTDDDKIYRYDGSVWEVMMKDEQKIDNFTLDGATLKLSIEGDEEAEQEIDLSEMDKYYEKYISISEYVRDEPILAQKGRILFTVHPDLDGYKTDVMQCSIHELGNAGTLEVSLLLRRESTDISINETVSFDSGAVYTGVSAGGSNEELKTGDLLYLTISEATTFSDAAKGMSCTIKLVK